jgi:flagellar transcriptional activator FlhD
LNIYYDFVRVNQFSDIDTNFYRNVLISQKALRKTGTTMAETANTNEIGDLNLTYLLLAQRLVREDVPTAMFRLGLSREVADLLGNLSLSQIVKLAASSLFLCRLRFDDHPVLSALTQDGKNLALQQAHAAILLSGQRIDALQ